MNTTLLTNNAEFDFSSRAIPLLDQLDQKVTPAQMSRAAVKACNLLTWATDQSAVEQASLVSRMSIATLRNTNLAVPDSLAAAVGVAALLSSAQAQRTTASERIRLAIVMLSERYQADW